jgi:uncharacterized protein involved in exopolysaccharide biosynthesis
MTLGPIRGAWSLARRVEELFAFQTQTREGLQLIDERLKALENRLLKLETEQHQVITAAGAAATAAASTVAGNILSDTVTRLTRVEMRTTQLETRQAISPPIKFDKS